ncbi:MAG TPA: ABC transporter permease subunit [Trebonia sp.]|jgi:putative spermidine/putrescine transport system permease protein
MTDTTDMVTTAPEPAAAGSGVRRFQNPLRNAPKPVREAARYLGAVPFIVYIVIFLIVPLIAILSGAFQNPDTGAFTWSNIDTAVHGSFLKGYEQSLELSLIASVIPGVFGLLLAYAIFTAKGRAAASLRQVVITASGVFANFGGVPLAFLFIASFGSTALVTGWLTDIGLNIYNDGFSLYTMSGVALVYMYFQIPLMVLMILPALEGLRPAWREAAENLGASAWSYWRFVGGPVLFPAFISAVMLLFGSALAAYATAEALTTGTIPLTSIQIGSFLNGNVIAGQENVGKALSLGMVVIIAVLMSVYVLFQRRSAKWLR